MISSTGATYRAERDMDQARGTMILAARVMNVQSSFTPELEIYPSTKPFSVWTVSVCVWKHRPGRCAPAFSEIA
jgi:hypothetical protein